MGPKKKGKKKPKDSMFMTDEEREAEDEAKKKAELEKLERERLMKEMEEELKRAKIAKKEQEQKEIEEEKLRNELLQKHCSEFETFKVNHFNFLKEKRNEEEWTVYSNCNHQPFANDPPALNTFLYTWQLLESRLNVKNVLKEMEIVLDTIKKSDEYIDVPLDLPKSTVQNLVEAKLHYHKEILNIIDKTTFNSIMDLSKYHKRISSYEFEVLETSKNFSLWLWGWALGGRCEIARKKVRPSRKSPMVLVTLPGIMEVNRYHMRIFYTSFDPYSFQNVSYHCPQVTNCKDLYEETEHIRKMEIKALKERYAFDYEEDIMPWWFLLDEEIVAEKKRKEDMKKKLNVKRKKINDASESSVTAGKPASASNVAVKQEILKKIDHEVKTEIVSEEEGEGKENKYQYFVKPGRTEILYSRSMTDLMEARRKECRGPQYYPEVDPITFLEDSDAGDMHSDSSAAREGVLLRTERHTTFRACLDTEVLDLEGAEILKDITKSHNPSDKSDERLSFTNRREFLDWKSLRDLSPDRDAILNELEEFLFGDTQTEIKDGKCIYTKRNPKLRSIKELFADVNPRKNLGNTNMAPEVRKNIEEILNSTSVPKPSSKVTNVTEMKEVEMEIANLLNTAFLDYTNEHIANLILSTESSTINLRQYTIIGGVFQFDFFEDEPQPVVNKEQFKMQLHYGEYKLKRAKFEQVPKIRIDLNVEMERKVSQAQRQKSISRKASKITSTSLELVIEEPEFSQTDDDLIWIALKLPKNVIFLESPTPVRWDVAKMCWTTDDIYDSRWSYKKNLCQFKLGKSGPFSVAIFRFGNLPFVRFHLKPSLDWNQNPAIFLELETRNFPITFQIKDDKIKISKIEFSKSDLIAHLIGVPMSLYDLINGLRKSGIDIFPDWDSFLYVNTTLKKLRSLEEHVYHSMAFACPAYEFKSSRHNATARDDRIYVDFREWAGPVPPDTKFQTVLVEPRKVVYVFTSESGFAKENPDGAAKGYMPDLWAVIKETCTKRSRRRMDRAPPQTIATVINLMTATKILSYT